MNLPAEGGVVKAYDRLKDFSKILLDGFEGKKEAMPA